VITTDWQARLVERDHLIGRNTNYPGIGGIRGLGVLDPRRSDVARSNRHGDARGHDRYPARTLTIPVVVLGETDDEVWANYRALAVAWRRSPVDLELELRIPGAAEPVVSYFGRPSGLPGEPRGLKGRLTTAAEFRGDTYAYGAAVTSAVDSASPLTILAADMGDPDTRTDRAVLTVIAAGGTPLIINTATGDFVQFAQPVTGTITIDLHTQTVTTGATNRDHWVTAGSPWFDLVGGIDNVLTFAGCTSVQITHRPAYEVP
jgi:phage-related protein